MRSGVLDEAGKGRGAESRGRYRSRRCEKGVRVLGS